MHIELVEKLRCLNAHEDSWLVAAFDRMDGRSVMDGTLGCPVCRASYAIANGVADFRIDGLAVAFPAVRPLSQPPSDGDVVRLAALLGLTEPGGVVVLDAPWSAMAEQLLAFSPSHVVVLGDERTPGASEQISVLRVNGVLPLVAGSVRGAAFQAGAPAVLVESAVRALTPRGRLIAAVGSESPGDLRELACDDEIRVSEKTVATSPIMSLGRRRQ